MALPPLFASAGTAPKRVPKTERCGRTRAPVQQDQPAKTSA
jgi:hypothetical protein